ncbi:hypothetical protein TNCT_398861 [Trichonephila clavata]|uniref:Uncharacterized protein n=1 Tax=Trichonephila clavata TaxID=2740835 RepID=A0A8X6LS67_TRICU|nr:hypothetical protein TNCT_398861 [Trichonephila clavata]
MDAISRRLWETVCLINEAMFKDYYFHLFLCSLTALGGTHALPGKCVIGMHALGRCILKANACADCIPVACASKHHLQSLEVSRMRRSQWVTQKDEELRNSTGVSPQRAGER